MWNPLSWVMEAAAVMAIALANGGVITIYYYYYYYYYYFYRKKFRRVEF
jgi:hypothetical protein